MESRPTDRSCPKPVFILLLAFLAAPFAVLADDCRSPIRVAGALLEGLGSWDAVPVTATYALDEAALDEGRLRANLRLDLGKDALDVLSSSKTDLCVSLVAEADGELLALHQRQLTVDVAGAEGWRYGFGADLTDGVSQLILLVEEPTSGRYGATLAEDFGEPLPGPGPRAIQLADAPTAWHEALRPVAAASSSGATAVIRVIPPRQDIVKGSTRFDALVTTDAVDRVEFIFDGEPAGTQNRRPYAVRVNVADPPRLQTLEAVAYDRDGRELGRDTLELHRFDVPFRARIRGVEGNVASGTVRVRGEASVPQEATLQRLELYLNERLVAQGSGPTLDTTVDTTGVGPDDYVRLAAYLADGTSIDDVVLLANPGIVDEVDVNLVQLHVIVNDADGHPVEDLNQADFTIRLKGQTRPTGSFAYADDVPLLLGLVVDTSGSMELVMHDTRKAAAKFLGTTVLPQDRSFLVDFKDKPRLLHPTTDDLAAVLGSLSKLVAEGATALYDAVAFSMLQFERQPGRKALVVLSDGDDYDSRFGPKYVTELAQRTGVPVYIIGLGNLDVLRRTYSKKDLRRITGQTGGRLYFVDSLEELDGAYAQIQQELRSQYSLTFYSDRDLTAEERRQVTVEIGRPDHTARVIVVDP